jgi:transposase
MIYQSSSISGSCPVCRKQSKRVHSRYTRLIQDLPVNEKAVYLQVQVKRFFCTNLFCERKVFTERFSWVEPYLHRTKRLHKVFTILALSTNCSAAARVAYSMHTTISHDSLLRLIHKMNIPVSPQPSRIGIDDFAFKKRNRYGTLIVDLDSKQPIEVLNSRSTSSVQSWLKEHPSIELVSRDGSKTYASAITNSLPEAIQVVDRWHLLKGLFDAYKQTLHDYLPSKWTKKTKVISSEAETHISPRKSDQIREKNTDQKWELILNVQELYRQGKTVAAIARQFHLARGTVYRYLKQDHRPDLRRSSICAPFLQTIQSFVIQCQTTDFIERKIRKEGYLGSRTTLDSVVAQIRRENRNHYTTETVFRSHLLSRLWKEEDFSKVIDGVPHSFIEAFPKLRVIHETIHSFRTLVSTQDHMKLDTWLAKYEKVDILSFKSFINGIKSDLEAVKNALFYSWNNGILEGYINKLKTIKRMMYGRASYELLKRRVLFNFEELF